jgi:20S proteasome subunit alpha 5
MMMIITRTLREICSIFFDIFVNVIVMFVHSSSLSSLLLSLLFCDIIIAVCDLALSFGEGSDGDSSKRMSRPFGVALLLAGYDELDGPQLFFSDPSGTFVRYKAKAIGAGSEGAQSNLSESYNENMTLEEAEELALSTLKQVMEEKISTDNVELARVVPERGFHIATSEEVGAVLERL